MHVLMVCKDAIVGGISRHCADLAKELSASGTRVTLVVPRSRSAAREVDLRGHSTIRPVSLARLFSTEISPGLAWHTLRARADVVHVHLPNPVATAGLMLPRLKPLIVTYHCDLDRRFGPLGGIVDGAARSVLERAAAIVVSSDDMRRSPVLRGLGARIHTVPYGMDATRLCVSDAVARLATRLRARLGNPADIVLFVGRLVYYKGLEVLLHAMKRVAAHLVVVGDGPKRAALQALVEQLGIDERVRFVGGIDDRTLTAYYHAARVVVLPSISNGEAFGIVQVEAALVGKPVVSTQLPGVSWVNVDGRTGFVVPTRDPDALARAIDTLLRDPALAAKMGADARARALVTFSASTMVTAMNAIYHSASKR